MITNTGEYALRAAVFLATHHPVPQVTAHIAVGTLVPQGYLSKILQALVRSNLVHSQRGLHGGFTLVHSPTEITVMHVLEAVGSAPERISTCPLEIGAHTELCALHRLVDDAVAHVQKAFMAATLASLVKPSQGAVPLCDSGRRLQRQERTHPT